MNHLAKQPDWTEFCPRDGKAAASASPYGPVTAPLGMAYNLSLIPWAIFGCVSFGARSLQGTSLRAREGRAELFRRLLFRTARAIRVRPNRLLAYGKTEFAESDHAHVHFLVGWPEGAGASAQEFSAKAAGFWTQPSDWRDEFGSGCKEWQAKIEPFRADLAHKGIAYVTKSEWDAYGNLLDPEEFLSKKLQRAITSCNEGRQLKQNPFVETNADSYLISSISSTQMPMRPSVSRLAKVLP